MRIALVNDIHVGKDLVKHGRVRAASSKVLEKFPKVIENIKVHNPDLIVNLGDLIRSSSAQEDLSNYKHIFQLLSALPFPIIHMLGNHEVKQLQTADIISVWKDHEVNQDTFGSLTISNIRCIWLDFDVVKNEKGMLAILSPERLVWLEQELAKDNTPTLLFTHYACVEQNYDGNYYFEKGLEIFAPYSNKEQILNVLKKHKNIVVVISAHTHAMSYKVVDDIPHFTLPAMVENIAAPEMNDNFPGIYTIIDINDKHVFVKSYSDEFCFSTVEVSR